MCEFSEFSLIKNLLPAFEKTTPYAISINTIVFLFASVMAIDFVEYPLLN